MADCGIKFFVPGIPVPGGSKRAMIIHQKGCPAGRRTRELRGHCVCKPFANVIDDACERNKNWRAMVAHTAVAEMRIRELPLFDGPLAVKMTFLILRPKHHYGKLGLLPSAPEYPTGKPDPLKLARATEDALTGICWRDDSGNVDLRIRKEYVQFKLCSPGVSIEIAPIKLACQTLAPQLL